MDRTELNTLIEKLDTLNFKIAEASEAKERLAHTRTAASEEAEDIIREKNAELRQKLAAIWNRCIVRTPQLSFSQLITFPSEQKFDSYEDVSAWLEAIDLGDPAPQRQVFTESCKQFDTRYLVFANEWKNTLAASRAELNIALNEAAAISNAEIECCSAECRRLAEECAALDVLHPDHYYLAESVSQMLKSRRADSLADALNLVIEEQREYEYRQEQLDMLDEKNRLIEEQNKQQRAYYAEMAQLQRESNEAQHQAAAERNRILQQQADHEHEYQRDQLRAQDEYNRLLQAQSEQARQAADDEAYRRKRTRSWAIMEKDEALRRGDSAAAAIYGSLEIENRDF